MKRFAWLVGIVTVLAAGIYIFVYLYRWEWHRALLVGVLFVGAEIGLATAFVVARLQKLASHERDRDDGVALKALQRSRPERRPFAWLDARDGAAVFLPILLGSGVVISAVAWVVEKVAARTVEPGFEQRLALSLRALSVPEDPLVPRDAECLHRECGDDEGLFVAGGAGP